MRLAEDAADSCRTHGQVGSLAQPEQRQDGETISAALPITASRAFRAEALSQCLFVRRMGTFPFPSHRLLACAGGLGQVQQAIYGHVWPKTGWRKDLQPRTPLKTRFRRVGVSDSVHVIQKMPRQCPPPPPLLCPLAARPQDLLTAL